jgi:hypothetical protein
MTGVGTDASGGSSGGTVRAPGPGAIQLIVVGWLAVITEVRFGALGGSGVGWSPGALAFLAAEVGLQSTYIFAARRLRRTALGWSVVAMQTALTYLPFVFYGHNWMAGNSGFLLGAVLLTAGPVAGLPFAIAIAAGDVVLTSAVLHMKPRPCGQSATTWRGSPRRPNDRGPIGCCALRSAACC